jgi:hypothetical protein
MSVLANQSLKSRHAFSDIRNRHDWLDWVSYSVSNSYGQSSQFRTTRVFRHQGSVRSEKSKEAHSHDLFSKQKWDQHADNSPWKWSESAIWSTHEWLFCCSLNKHSTIVFSYPSIEEFVLSKRKSFDYSRLVPSLLIWISEAMCYAGEWCDQVRTTLTGSSRCECKSIEHGKDLQGSELLHVLHGIHWLYEQIDCLIRISVF